MFFHWKVHNFTSKTTADTESAVVFAYLIITVFRAYYSFCVFAVLFSAELSEFSLMVI